MTKLHHKGATDSLQIIANFLATCRAPAVLEEGESPIALGAGTYMLETRGGRLCIEAADQARVLSRTITSVGPVRPGILDCTFQRFGGAQGKLSFLDLDRPQSTHRRTAATRQSFSEQFRRMLRRQFPGWELKILTTGMDLRRSFSPTFPRAVLTRGQLVIAAMACPRPESEVDLLTFALLWFDHVAGANSSHASLCLFLPEGAGSLTAHRLRWLRSALLKPRLFLFNEHGSAGEVDGHDLGNLDTRVGSRYTEPHLSPTLDALVQRLSDMPQLSIVPELAGALSIRLRGVEFARAEHDRLWLGLTDKQEISPDQFHSAITFAEQLLSLQDAPSSPERWLEGNARANLQAIDPTFLPAPVHGQVLTFAGSDRNAVDLLAISADGRLTVLELKAVEDLHLPLQALDYWMRIRWHLERQELAHLFPAQTLDLRPPRLCLVSPALSFHSTLETVLRYFSPEVEVERVGVASDWQTRFRVVLRLTGANTPISHRGTEWHYKP